MNFQTLFYGENYKQNKKFEIKKEVRGKKNGKMRKTFSCHPRTNVITNTIAHTKNFQLKRKIRKAKNERRKNCVKKSEIGSRVRAMFFICFNSFSRRYRICTMMGCINCVTGTTGC